MIGFDNEQKNFFWLVAQGGYGIQTAPALAEISRDIIIKNEDKIDDLYDISINRLR
ncbi:FAD-binding oxidoreductase [Pelagibacterales bacterium SAG-MED31]|nr:FAD-binding oxidoreductase [Pelagibacterales bacterium SAG-MED31]